MRLLISSKQTVHSEDYELKSDVLEYFAKVVKKWVEWRINDGKSLKL